MAAERSWCSIFFALISSHLRYYFLFSAYHQTFAFLVVSSTLSCILSFAMSVQLINKQTNNIKNVAIFLKYDFHFLLRRVRKYKILLEIYVLKHLDMNLCISSWKFLLHLHLCAAQNFFFFFLSLHMSFSLSFFSRFAWQRQEDNCNATIFFISSWVLKTKENKNKVVKDDCKWEKSVSKIVILRKSS